MPEAILLAACIFVMALLYSSVGHGGASGYLAAMALFSLAPPVMRPAALILNVIVAGVASVRFYQAGCFSWRIFAPFALASVPFAYLGGTLTLSAHIYKQIVGAALLFAAWQVWRHARRAAGGAIEEARRVPLVPAALCGAVLGFLSGAVGVGGGIFLSPLLLLTRWATVRQASGVAACFIVVNSLAGLFGARAGLSVLPPAVAVWAIAALAGGIIGAELGSRHFANRTLRLLLAIVLVIAGVKLVLT